MSDILLSNSYQDNTLEVSSQNPRYFADKSGNIVFLTGSHTWDNRQDQGTGAFDWDTYIANLVSWGHNFFRLWVWEQPKNITTSPDPINPTTTLTPEIWLRTGPGNAADGGLKFDLTQYNSTHFDRLRARCIDAGNHGLYASIMLFDGWSVALKGGGSNPWTYHPFENGNNINSIDGDTNNDGAGYETEDLSISAVTTLQEAYVAHVIDTVNDLDNVLYEVCNESDISTAWQNHFIDYIHTYEATRPKQHPVGFTATSADNSFLLASNAEWIAPNGGDGYLDGTQAANDGTKVIVCDNDHIFGISGSTSWYWKCFCRGANLLYMDAMDGHFLTGTGSQNIRDNLGYIRTLAGLAGLINMAPQNGGTSPCATGYCLYGNSQYICYQSANGNFTLDLSGESGTFNIRKVNLADGSIDNAQTTTGGASRTITQPTGWTSGWAAWVRK